ncbi:ABC transporter permease [Candidatus Aerophobetes bacterium]|nr:ABC transporter permease [Candidatus Aerophobetes bacterium]
MRMSVLTWLKSKPEFGTFASFLCIFIFFGVFAPRFLTIESIGSMLNMAVELGIVVVGVTLLMTGGEFDLSVGSVFALGNFVFIYLILQNFPIFLGFILAIASGVIIGIINGWITTRFAVPSFIVTLGMLWAIRGFLLFLATKQWWTLYGIQSTFLDVLNGKTFIFYNAVFWFLVLVVIGHIVLENTRFGNQIRACGGDKLNARFMGINVNKLKIFTFMLTGGLAAFAGTTNLSRFRYFHWYLGVGMELEAVAAVVLGGTLLTGGYGTLIGSLIGVLLLSMLRNGMILLGIPGYWYQAIIGAFFIIAMALNIKLRAKR